MDKWKGKVACVSGASAGIGANITKTLADAGMTVIGLGRRIEPIQVCVYFVYFAISKSNCRFDFIYIFTNVLSFFLTLLDCPLGIGQSNHSW